MAGAWRSSFEYGSRLMARSASVFVVTIIAALFDIDARAQERLDKIKVKGSLVCGISPGVAGFSEMDTNGRYVGLDVDICRAVSAAILARSDNVVYKTASSVGDLFRSDDIDIVSRRLTWSLEREASFSVRFGPITFYDGQGFLVARQRGIRSVNQLAGMTVCVQPGTESELRLGVYFRARRHELKKVLIDSATNLGKAFDTGRCDAYTADVSVLGSIRSKLPNPDRFDILRDQISKEPLAQLVRAGDTRLLKVLQWTIFALIGAEELGISSENVDWMARSDDSDVKRFLGIIPGSGKALGLDDKWAYQVIRLVGNYGQMFERNLGPTSRINLNRGLNALWTAGGLMYAPPLR
jgi:general L-amino acid transport system substrate-binding protein